MVADEGHGVNDGPVQVRDVGLAVARHSLVQQPDLDTPGVQRSNISTRVFLLRCFTKLFTDHPLCKTVVSSVQAHNLHTSTSSRTYLGVAPRSLDKNSAYLEYPLTVKDEDGSAVQRKYNMTLSVLTQERLKQGGNVLPKCIDVRETPGPGPNNQWVCHLLDTTLPNIRILSPCDNVSIRVFTTTLVFL